MTCDSCGWVVRDADGRIQCGRPRRYPIKITDAKRAACNRRRAASVKRFDRLLVGVANVAKDAEGWTSIFYKNGAVFRCRGPVVDESVKLMGLNRRWLNEKNKS